MTRAANANEYGDQNDATVIMDRVLVESDQVSDVRQQEGPNTDHEITRVEHQGYITVKREEQRRCQTIAYLPANRVTWKVQMIRKSRVAGLAI